MIKPKKHHRKNKPTQPIVGLSEIFYPGFTKESLKNELSGILDTGNADSTVVPVQS